MIGPNFSINATNIGHAALREVAMAVDSPVVAGLIPLTQPGDEKVGVLVTSRDFRQVLPISETRVRMCIDAAGMDETQRYVEELAAEIRSAQIEAEA